MLAVLRADQIKPVHQEARPLWGRCYPHLAAAVAFEERQAQRAAHLVAAVERLVDLAAILLPVCLAVAVAAALLGRVDWEELRQRPAALAAVSVLAVAAAIRPQVAVLERVVLS